MTYQQFCSQFNICLNSQQTEAVRSTDGPVLLLAVPGSGKTTVLVTRLGYMIYGMGLFYTACSMIAWDLYKCCRVRSRNTA